MIRDPIQRPLAWALLAFVLLLAGCSRPVPPLSGQGDPDRTLPWSEDCVEQMASLPLQDNGRIKPLSVMAAFTLYHVHGRRDLKYSLPAVDDGEGQKVTLEPTEWLLDVWCYPGQAARYPLFRIEHVGVLDALGFENDGQKQDFVYLSFSEVYTRAEKLQQLARSYSEIDQKKRNTVQEHILQLWRRFLTYDTLQRQLGALHYSVPVEAPELRDQLGGERVTFGSLVKNADAFKRIVAASDPQLETAPAGLVEVIDFVGKAITNDEDGAGLLAPTDKKDTKWLTLGEAFEAVVRGERGPRQQALEHLADAVALDSLGNKETALLAFRAAALEAARGHYDEGTIALETGYYRAAWHYQSIHWFLLAFVLAAVCWMLPKNRILWWASIGVTVLALGMLSYDLVLRCLITGRPPIKNLYDTFLFIAAVAVLASIVTEFVLPRRIALAAAPALGALLVMFARMFEVSNASDTMDPLVAVLDSNFWLATHVTTINIGYAAGILAALLANFWIGMRALRVFHPSDASMKALVRMIYGVTCFGLIFAVVGTILGGVWANDSWGRFWGWDPKENGALMICLAQIALLHARFSGWVRDFGFVVWAAITGMVVVFSWFHVNLLGIGLHSYGFSDSMRSGVWWSYMTQLGFVAVGTIDVLLRPNPAPVAAATATADAPPLPAS